MFDSLIAFIKEATGSELASNNLTFFHLSVRVLIVFIEGLLLARINHRLTGRNSSLDFIMRIIIGTLLATAIVGNPFFPVLAIVPFIVLANMILAIAASYHPTLEYLIKGPTPLLVEEGTIHWTVLRFNYISKEDLMEAIRENNLTHVKEVKRAYLEKDGKISILSYK